MKDPRYRGMLLWVVAAVLIILVNGILSGNSKQEATAEDAYTAEGYRISYTGADRTGVLSDYDATEQYIFFSYSEKLSVVDAYDQSGQYAFSIHVEEKNNGVVYIRCVDNLLYILSKNDNVFVFDGDTLVRYYPAKDADALGYDFYWFYEASSNVVLRGFRLMRLDAEGNIGGQVTVPNSVIRNYYRKYSVFAGMLFVTIICLCRLFIKRRGS